MAEPVPMIMNCPSCGERHVDDDGRPPHKTHACQSCGLLWRPALVPTRGVRFLPGCRDEPPAGESLFGGVSLSVANVCITVRIDPREVRESMDADRLATLSSELPMGDDCGLFFSLNVSRR